MDDREPRFDDPMRFYNCEPPLGRVRQLPHVVAWSAIDLAAAPGCERSVTFQSDGRGGLRAVITTTPVVNGTFRITAH